jgi:hypothetical protein
LGAGFGTGGVSSRPNSFRIAGGAVVDASKLYSLRLEDALPHHAIKLTVQAALCSKEAAAAMGATYNHEKVRL